MKVTSFGRTRAHLLAGLAIAMLLTSCIEDLPAPLGNEPEAVQYDPTPYSLNFGNFPTPLLPADNPLTITGVALGRSLFHEKGLSGDLTQSCADCHLQEDGFSDERRFSIGIEGLPGRRQAMPVVNLAYHRNGFFWDGRAPTLRDQSLRPIQDPLEMNETLENAIAKLQNDPDYPDAFIRAFGDSMISAENMSLALEQFMFTMISANARFDRFQQGSETFTASEQRGLALFNTEFNPMSGIQGAGCNHCHGGFNFTNDQFMNNGLDDGASFTDLGRFEVTGLPGDRAQFKVPTLRNIAQTAPYMHDGRFNTLREVIDHYDHGIQPSPTLDPVLALQLGPGLLLSEQDKQDLEAFMLTLTDGQFLSNPAFAAP